MEGKTSTQRERFLTFTSQLKISECLEGSETVWVLKYIQNLAISEKKSFGKKLIFFFEIGKGGKFAVECLSNDSIS